MSLDCCKGCEKRARCVDGVVDGAHPCEEFPLELEARAKTLERGVSFSRDSVHTD